MLDLSPDAAQALRTAARLNDSTAYTLRAQADAAPTPAVRDAMLALADRHLRLAVHQRQLARAMDDTRTSGRHGQLDRSA
ncbi:hypothetical protein GCM10008956_11980 [Deinococcus arenae]|uniref:Uncharacterized protein n=1 Tax=Deinococcus arenae TaxID=1452751 RepID=A0A8H9GLA9_9DEIO|nr:MULTISPECIES: hypothetical protein [Deinococcus]AWT37605.1 hypothetical protein DM785_18075 [Deinococcus actinosclerus]GGM37073.1 hypothetical protein GCM10008956_11980 [Deinococcus arenae]